ncbi:hypothetical protein [Corallococcus carmarthensis]|uniref:Uncharacterized protein n=1 Tax=Corallococcus carmarthensis TaxID=2316728 RepID=A0A3A8KFT3_9BACT|nr:hypothetical protein [Corallococcus carmarthensis]NOK19762.1 hypothetical protein [Corallococcus carmarthensis]RKH06177.1 hypothetical protein D7X32_05610 [Corallococcus carmarthensis]
MRTFLIGGLLAMAVGCGGPMELEEGSDLASQESALPDCLNTDNMITYYNNASHSIIVGQRGCYCGNWVSWGQTSSTYWENTSC